MSSVNSSGDTGFLSMETRIKYLRIALFVFGLFLIFALSTFVFWLWPAGWAWGWQEGWHSHYVYMILSMFAVMGVMFLFAIRDPLAYASLIWFAVWSSIAHACVMLVLALREEAERGHLVGDIPMLFIMAATFAILMPRGARTDRRT
jgi:hypothetical protein